MALGSVGIFYLKRLWLLENFEILFREAVYHRDYDKEEQLPGITIYEESSHGVDPE